MATSNSIHSLPFCVVVGNGRGEMSCFCKATGMFQSNEHSHSHSGTYAAVGSQNTIQPVEPCHACHLIMSAGTEILPVSSSVQPRPPHPQAQRHAIVGSQNGEADPGEADIISHG
ncbi:uncharacterized protein RSE6_07539 [Rhynchosporium secalis]|uniref:Uncharacterized protein n=1 Tax=Rhynchosporium secalis TaxID=38038 RepID=A0A1E1MD28_RHYSE|nr:uncharacterized protein RSE6_07539 [Rhynchosporium secalis]